MQTNDQIVLEKLLAAKKESIAPEMGDSAFFGVFVAEQLLKDFDLSWDEIEDGIVDGGGDGGIDGIYFFVNGQLVDEDANSKLPKKDVVLEVHVLQSKTSASFSQSAVERLVATCQEIFHLDADEAALKAQYNSRLLAVARRFGKVYLDAVASFPKVQFHFHYASKGSTDEVHPNVQAKVAHLQSAIRDLISDADVTFRFWGAKELVEYVRRQPSSTYKLPLAENAISPGAGGEDDQGSYLALVKLDDYARFVTAKSGEMDRTVQEANVRDYQGDVTVNRGIRQSLEEPTGEDFWWLNNGVTILASRASLSSKVLTVENPRVVNGLQTSAEIYRFFSASSGSAEGGTVTDVRNILVRVVVTNDDTKRDRIIRATNSQTAIPEAYLRSTESIHRDIEDFFKSKGYFYDRRKNFYKNEGKPIARIIRIPQLAQEVMATQLRKPNDARARPSSLMKDDEDLKKIFSHDYPLPMYLNAVLLVKLAEQALRDRDYSLTAKDVNNLKFHTAMAIMMLALSSEEPSATQIAEMAPQDVSDCVCDVAVELVRASFTELGETDQVAKGRDFYERVLGKTRVRLEEDTSDVAEGQESATGES